MTILDFSERLGVELSLLETSSALIYKSLR